MTKRKPAPDDGPALYWTGTGFLSGIPARDLTTADLARIAWVERGPERAGTPADIPADEIAATGAALVATGFYGAEPAALPAAEDLTHE